MIGLYLLCSYTALCQPCTPLGNQLTYGTNDTWIGYVYDNVDLTSYKGYVTEGSPGNPNFLQEFGGMYATYPTNGCSVYTESFSVRYRLTKTFSAGDYDFTVAGDDGYRLSLDGGVTWLINNWFYVGFNQNTVTTYLNGTYNLVLEFYDLAHSNRISFQVSNACIGPENTSTYGTGNIWRGYVYNDESFLTYKGLVNEGSAGSADFDQNFGGSYNRFNTSSCALLAEHFSVRYRLSKTFPVNNYSIIVGSEDGYRLSLDGGTTWLIDNWSNVGYNTTTVMMNLSGTYNMILEYHETTGANRIMFSAGTAILLPVNLVYFTARNTGSSVLLQWEIGLPEDISHFEIERSKDGQNYQFAGNKSAEAGNTAYTYTDMYTADGSVFYRLKIIEKSGKVSYSNGIMVNGNRQTMKIFPSFVNNNVVYVASDKNMPEATFTFADMNGRAVGTYRLKNISSGQTISIFLPGKLAKGMYIARLESSTGLVSTEKIFLQ